jgi:TadE-like protein
MKRRMTRLWNETRGQAFAELACVIFLFLMFLTAVTQFVILGTAHIRLEQAARRAAWLGNVFNNSFGINGNNDQIQSYYPCQIEVISHDRTAGSAYRLKAKVPAIGFFHWFEPDGFEITAQSAVIAYNPKPYAAQVNDFTAQKAMDLYNKIKGQ